MGPILFTLGGPHLNFNSGRRRGVPPNLCGAFPLPTARWSLAGVTRDETAAATPGFAVYLQRMVQGVPVLVQQDISDAAGAYSFSVNPADQYWITSYKAGSPDKAGATLNTLTGA